MAEVTRKQGKKCRKYGRKIKKPTQIRYTSEKRWIINKAKKLFRYIKKHPKVCFNNLNPDIKLVLDKLISKK